MKKRRHVLLSILIVTVLLTGCSNSDIVNDNATTPIQDEIQYTNNVVKNEVLENTPVKDIAENDSLIQVPDGVFEVGASANRECILYAGGNELDGSWVRNIYLLNEKGFIDLKYKYFTKDTDDVQVLLCDLDEDGNDELAISCCYTYGPGVRLEDLVIIEHPFEENAEPRIYNADNTEDFDSIYPGNVTFISDNIKDLAVFESDSHNPYIINVYDSATSEFIGMLDYSGNNTGAEEPQIHLGSTVKYKFENDKIYLVLWPQNQYCITPDNALEIYYDVIYKPNGDISFAIADKKAEYFNIHTDFSEYDTDDLMQEEEFSYEGYLEGYEPGMIFPNFIMTDASDNDVNLYDYRGKALYLNFFTTWCPYCFYEIPDMEQIASQYGDDITVLLVDLAENAELASEYAETYGVSLPINNYPYWDVGRHSISGVPESFVLDKHGIIVDYIEGMTNYEWMNAAVSSAVLAE